MEDSKYRQPNETMQQYRGRQKREMNAANDALNLVVGEPIRCGGRHIRFHLGLIDRRNPKHMERLQLDDLIAFLAAEKIKQDEQAVRSREHSEREAFYARQDVRDAEMVRHIIEDRLKLVIDRLTPAEWAEFRKRLEA